MIKITIQSINQYEIRNPTMKEITIKMIIYNLITKFKRRCFDLSLYFLNLYKFVIIIIGPKNRKNINSKKKIRLPIMGFIKTVIAIAMKRKIIASTKIITANFNVMRLALPFIQKSLLLQLGHTNNPNFFSIMFPHCLHSYFILDI